LFNIVLFIIQKTYLNITEVQPGISPVRSA